MAGKRTARTSGSAPKQARGRRTATGGGPPARSRRNPGNSGFSGYEYQIEVTIWVALDLMLAKAATDEVIIEPRSEEDLEAAVTDPAAASLGLTAQGARLDLILQAKTRWARRGRRRLSPMSFSARTPMTRIAAASAAGRWRYFRTITTAAIYS